MNQLEQKLDSREVAEMIEKAHSELLKDVRRYTKQLAEVNIPLGDFFTESSYADANNQKRPCYLVTKKGCEFIAHKLTGVKGTEFTAKYINRFHEMEGIIQDHIPQGKELLALAVLEAQKTIEEQNAQISEMKPKAIFADAVSASDSSILIRDLAKILRQNGVKIGERRFYNWLRENGYICKNGTSPTQRAMELGLFETVIRTIERGNGLPIETKTTRVTGKGQQYFINKFLQQGGERICVK